MPPVVSSLSDAAALGAVNSAVTVGVFDGVHSGHRHILDRLLEAKHNGTVESCFVVTFDPHPVLSGYCVDCHHIAPALPVPTR